MLQETGPTRRRFPIGTEVLRDGSASFRVWAPNARRVTVLFDGSHREETLLAERGGYYSGTIANARAGMRYRIRPDNGEAFPDPASRFQPEGPHGPSEIVDPSTYQWTDDAWKGRDRKDLVLYELHPGTFTKEGSWAAAREHLPFLAGLGITAIEVMPVADFPGSFGWGYDGVNLFAPTRLYGRPDDFRDFVDYAHAHGLAVILDVVYNHLGPDGNYLKAFSSAYFTDHYKNEWGEPLNFDGESSDAVRELFVTNAEYWIIEYHLDGLRLDATQQIFDGSETHILLEISRKVRAAASSRKTVLIAENEPQQPHLLRSQSQGGFELDALWNDDFHHSAVVALTGRNEAYYSDYLGTSQELLSATKWGFLFQGQRYRWQKKPRGGNAFDIPPEAFINFLENHDQVANSGWGQRMHQLTSPGRFRALTALLLLAPATPMLFQGQEFASSAPFLYFADHTEELNHAICRGRLEFLSQFPSLSTPEMQAAVPNPCLEETFRRCVLDHGEKKKNAAVVELHRDLLRLRKEDPVLARRKRRGFDGAVLSDHAFVLRYFERLPGEPPHSDPAQARFGDRLLIVNTGTDLRLDSAPEPLLAPPAGYRWRLSWSSEDVRYGGHGMPEVETEEYWRIPGEAAILLMPEKEPEKEPGKKPEGKENG